MRRSEKALKYFEENKDFIQDVVKPSIEKNRKGTAKITLVKNNSEDVKNIKIKVTQKKHAFKYGANIFMLDEFECENKNLAYREYFKEVCNIATLPFYWCDNEPEQGKPRYAVDNCKIYRRPPIDLCVNYCADNGIEPKCHCLNYDNFAPDWIKDVDVAFHKEMLEKRFKELSERYSNKIPSWEVINESLNVGLHYETKFFKENDFIDWTFETAEKYFHNNHLIINDYKVFGSEFCHNRSQYYMLIQRLLGRDNIHLDSIGMQFHCFFKGEDEEKGAKTMYNPVYLYEVFNKYAELGKKLQITEMTIPALSESVEDEDIQAELIKNLYTVFFSHPSMEAIIYWNLVDGYAAFAPQGDMSVGENVYYGGMLRFDMTKKKAFYIVRDLFNKEWHTEETGYTDEKGNFEFRGFYGSYDVEVILDGKTVTNEIDFSNKSQCEFKIIL